MKQAPQQTAPPLASDFEQRQSTLKKEFTRFVGAVQEACGADADAMYFTGFDPFLKNTWRLVCEQCAHDESATEY